MLDLSENKLDEKAASALLSWLQLQSLDYINLGGNPMSLKRIGLLYEQLSKGGMQTDAIQTLMRKVIFMSAGYVKKASDQVAVYKKLVQEKRIPADWADTHNTYYRLPLLKQFRHYKETINYKALVSRIKVLALTYTINTPPVASESSDDDSSDDGGMTFYQAVSKLTPRTDIK